MYFRVKAWNAFELSCSAVFCYPQENFQCHKRIWKFWSFEDCTELMGIVMAFSSFGWTEASVFTELFTELFTTGPPRGQTVCTSGITTRLSPARRVAALSCKRQSLVQGHSSFSWWPPSVWEAGAGWGVDEQQVGVADQKICTWRCELGAGNRAGERGREEERRRANKEFDSERRKLRWRTGAVLTDHWVGGEGGWSRAVCTGRIAYSVLFFRTRNWAQRAILCSVRQNTLSYSTLA